MLKLNLDRTYYFKNGKACSNTTLVKVKFNKNWTLISDSSIQIQHLLKLNGFKRKNYRRNGYIQIQHLLKLNKKILVDTKKRANSNTTLVKVKWGVMDFVE